MQGMHLSGKPSLYFPLLCLPRLSPGCRAPNSASKQRLYPIMDEETARAEIASARAALAASGRKTRLLAHRTLVLHSKGNSTSLEDHVHALKAFVRARENTALAKEVPPLDTLVRNVLRASFDKVSTDGIVFIGELRAYMRQQGIPEIVVSMLARMPRETQMTWTELRKTLELMCAGVRVIRPIPAMQGSLSPSLNDLVHRIYKSCQRVNRDVQHEQLKKTNKKEEEEEEEEKEEKENENAAEKHVRISEFCARFNRHPDVREFSRFPLQDSVSDLVVLRGLDDASAFIFDVLGPALQPEALRGPRRNEAVCRGLSFKLEKNPGRSIDVGSLDLREHFEKHDSEYTGVLSKRKIQSVLAANGVHAVSNAFLERFCMPSTTGKPGAVDYYAFLNLGLGVSLQIREAMVPLARAALRQLLEAGCSHPCTADSRISAFRRIQHFTETEKLTRAVLRLIEAYPGGAPRPQDELVFT